MNEQEDRRIVENRYRELPSEIQRISRNNPIVHRLLEMYAHGQILTREELLCQMVVVLARNWETQRQSYEDCIKRSLFVPTLPKAL